MIHDYFTLRRFATQSLLVVAAALAGGGCGERQPKGQVVAVVNGAEITIAELNEEARSRGIAAADDPRARSALLEELIDRKLLVEQARDGKLDQSPEHLLAVRRLEEMALAQQLLAERMGEDAVRPPNSMEEYIRANPNGFENRALVTLDLLQVGEIRDPRLRLALSKARSMEAIEALLAGTAVKPLRRTETWDTATPPSRVQLGTLRLASGDLFILPYEGGLLAGKVIARVPQPVAPEQRLPLARQLIQRQRAERLFEQLVRHARSAAKVSYQADFGPTAS